MIMQILVTQGLSVWFSTGQRQGAREWPNWLVNRWPVWINTVGVHKIDQKNSRSAANRGKGGNVVSRKYRPSLNRKAEAEVIVRTLPKGAQTYHLTYGLWICHTLEATETPARKPYRPRCFEYYVLSHLVDGEGWLWTHDTGTQLIEPGQAILIMPGYICDYGGNNVSYVEDNVCFTGRIADSFRDLDLIKTGIINMGKERVLRDIIRTATDPAFNSQIRANLSLQSLLVNIFLDRSAECASAIRMKERIDNLLFHIQQNLDKWWTVKEMAEMCHLSESQFRRKFLQHTGLYPKNYIDRLRIQRAAVQLCNSELTITEIAEHMGYTNPFHFSRRFKEVTGISPQQYRNEFQLNR